MLAKRCREASETNCAIWLFFIKLLSLDLDILFDKNILGKEILTKFLVLPKLKDFAY
jgi:hypothetical protein